MRPPDVIHDARTDPAMPPGFSPAALPILSLHWFGIPPPPWQPLGAVVARAIGRLRMVDVDEDRAA